MTILGNLGVLHKGDWWIDDVVILTLWREGMDTLDIARGLGVHESAVANRLPKALESARKEWNASS